jgi:hypothetical protein
MAMRMEISRRRALRRQKVGHVGAGDQQHEAHRAHQHGRGPAGVRHHLPLQRRDLDSLLALAFRVRFGETPRDAVHLHARLWLRRPATQAPDRLQAPRGPVQARNQRHEDLGLAAEPARRKMEAVGQDAQNGIRMAVELRRPSQDCPIAMEPPGPKAVTQQHHAVAVGGGEGTAQHRLNPQHVEQAGS